MNKTSPPHKNVISAFMSSKISTIWKYAMETSMLNHNNKGRYFISIF